MPKRGKCTTARRRRHSDDVIKSCVWNFCFTQVHIERLNREIAHLRAAVDGRVSKEFLDVREQLSDLDAQKRSAQTLQRLLDERTEEVNAVTRKWQVGWSIGRCVDRCLVVTVCGWVVAHSSRSPSPRRTASWTSKSA